MELDTELQKVNNDINHVIDEVVEGTWNKTEAEKNNIKTIVSFLINSIVIFITYINCCKKNDVTNPEASNITNYS